MLRLLACALLLGLASAALPAPMSLTLALRGGGGELGPRGLNVQNAGVNPKMLLHSTRIRGGDDDYDDPDAVPSALLDAHHCLGFILAALLGVQLPAAPHGVQF